jgi:Permuted papain-like amidase enzyme, YaeF/YiiX, C92 family
MAVTIQAGDILLYKSNGSFIEDEISKITHSPYVHVAIAVGDGYIIEANGFIRTREIPVSEEPGYDVFRIPGLTDEQRKQIVEFAKSKLGTEYDYGEIVGLLIRFELWPTFPGFHEAGHYICSSLVDQALIAADVHRKNNAFIGNLSPGELLTYYDFKLVN